MLGPPDAEKANKRRLLTTHQIVHQLSNRRRATMESILLMPRQSAITSGIGS
jgi:hypothetical protein